MKKTEKIQYKGSIVTVRRWYHRDTGGLKRRCFVCRKEIQDGEVTLLANNYKHIPNILIHSECLDKWEGRKEELCGKIEEEYLDWMEKNEIFGTFVQHFDAFRILG